MIGGAISRWCSVGRGGDCKPHSTHHEIKIGKEWFRKLPQLLELSIAATWSYDSPPEAEPRQWSKRRKKAPAEFRMGSGEFGNGEHSCKIAIGPGGRAQILMMGICIDNFVKYLWQDLRTSIAHLRKSREW